MNFLWNALCIVALEMSIFVFESLFKSYLNRFYAGTYLKSLQNQWYVLKNKSHLN